MMTTDKWMGDCKGYVCSLKMFELTTLNLVNVDFLTSSLA